MSTAQTANGLVLNSWKEIAAYLGRGVRTVQRYERELGLPVRRPRGKSRSAVIAMTDELDAWLRNAPRGELDKREDENDLFVFTGELRNLGMSEASQELLDRCKKLRDENISLTMDLMCSLKVTVELVTRVRTTRLAGGGGLWRSQGQPAN